MKAPQVKLVSAVQLGTDRIDPGCVVRSSPFSALAAEMESIERLVARARGEGATGRRTSLPGTAWFLDDGRVLCGERFHGDSRIPYGRDGVLFWVTASGRMHGNDGLYHLFLPTGEGEDPPIAFLAGRREKPTTPFRPLAMLPVPFVANSETDVRERYSVLGRDASYFVTRSSDLRGLVRVFMAQDHRGPRIVFSLCIENTTSANLELFTSAYFNPFCRHQFAPTHEDRWFKRISAEPEPTDILPPFIVSVNEDVSRFQSVTNYALVQRTAASLAQLTSAQVCTAQAAYLGSVRRALASASFLESGVFSEDPSLTVFNDNAVAGDLLRWELPPQSAIETHYALTFPHDVAALGAETRHPLSPGAVESLFAAHRDVVAEAEGPLTIKFGGSRNTALCADTCNHFMPFLKMQVEVCAQVRGYMHPSPNSLIGIRDVFQAVEGQLYDQPAAARRKILEALDYVLIDGRCPRQYSLPVNGVPGRADLREFIDQGLWVISTLHTYVCVTGDNGILSEPVGYHRLKPQDDSALVRAADRDSVLEHLLCILDFLGRQRDLETGLLRALYGDWNDALDGLGNTDIAGEKFGTGVSVMASLQLYRNCTELGELLERFGGETHRARRSQIERMRGELRASLLRHAVVQQNGARRIVHGWGDRRAYYVGSFADSDGCARDGLTSNAFWVLSGMLTADPSLRGDILAAFNRLDSPYGLKTFEPGFAPDAPGVGRIPKLPIGTAENGATYIHATVFGIMALFAMGEPRRAWEQIVKILPFTPGHDGISHSPFVMPNSYVANAELNLTGQNMNDWQTGSSNVLLKTLIRDAFGFEAGLDDLRVAPAGWSPFERMTLCCRAHGQRLRIELHRGEGERRFLLNGEPMSARYDDARGIPFIRMDYTRLHERDENVVQVIDASVRDVHTSH